MACCLLMSFIFACMMLQAPATLTAQVLPAERATDWSLAGARVPDTSNWPVIDITERGGWKDGSQPNNSILDAIQAELNGNGGVVYFPTGDYRFEGTITLTGNIILRGPEQDTARLLFDNGGTGDLIVIPGQATALQRQLVAPALMAANTVELADAAGLSPGDICLLSSEDSHLVTSDWALNSTGQINEVTAVNGNTVTFRSPFRRDFDTADQAILTLLEPARHVGVEQLQLERLDATSTQTSNIQFQYAADCWVRCLVSRYANFAHITVSQSTRIGIDGSYFRDAFAYGGGGQGYGVVLQYGSGECLVRDNIFRRLRHAMLLQAGANGNVLSYNYSIEPFWTGVALPSNSAGDLVLHGNYPYLNLFEGNTVQNIVIDNSHGINGPFNTFLRNRAELYGLVMNDSPASDSQNFLGNEIPNTNLFMGNFLLAGNEHFEYGNNVRGEMQPAGTEDGPVTSLYLQDQPDYPLTAAWPLIGPPLEMNVYLNDAQQRYAGGSFTFCQHTVVSSLWQPATAEISLFVFPNPTTGMIYLNLPVNDLKDLKFIRLMGRDGKQHSYSVSTNQIDLHGRPAGLYLLQLHFRDGSTSLQKVMVAH